MTKRVIAVAGLAVLLSGGPAGAVIIDDFSVAQGPLSGFATDQQVGPMLGGERDANVFSGGSYQTVGGAATWSGNNGSLTYDGVDGSPTPVYGLVGVDLTDGGLSDRFLIDVTSVTGSVSFSILAGESLAGDLRGSSSPVAQPGMATVLFSSFAVFGSGADLADIRRVSLNLQSVGSTDSVTFDNFCTGNASGCVGGPSTAVPEPGTWLLLAGGLALLGLRRRRA